MKRLLMIITTLFCVTLSGFAKNQFDQFYFELSCEKYVKVKLDYSKATYRNVYPFSSFLNIAPRSAHWESGSIQYFIDNANIETSNVGLILLPPEAEQSGKFELDIIIDNVWEGGEIQGKCAFKDLTTGLYRKVIKISSNDGDDNDEIALRDALKKPGRLIGKLLKKEIMSYR